MSDDCSAQAAGGTQTTIPIALKICLGKWCGWKVSANSSMTRTSRMFFYCNVPKDAPPVSQATPILAANANGTQESSHAAMFLYVFYLIHL